MKTQSNNASTIEHESLETIFKSMLTEVYYAQKQLSGVYEEMATAAHHEELKKTFEVCIHNTSLQVSRIEKCMEMLELTPDKKYADAVSGFVADAQVTVTKFGEGHVRDAALIATAQKIEHYGISVYGTLRTMATVLGRVQCAQLLEENKDEEAESDEALTRLAMNINTLALEGA